MLFVNGISVIGACFKKTLSICRKNKISLRHSLLFFTRRARLTQEK